MCGIAGFWTAESGLTADRATATLKKMSDALIHRGPDSGGLWKDDGVGIGLCHRRLSILDLSAAGSQPMHSKSGRYVIVYNGEIYNHLELRKVLEADLAPVNWSGHSDTETLLAAIDNWGLEKTLSRLVGMFAFAVWDRHERKLALARDRIGEKPLYYGRIGRSVVFASELKALSAFPGFQRRVDRNAVALLLTNNYIPAPHSIYNGIGKLVPGCVIEIADTGSDFAEPKAYWSIEAVHKAAKNNAFTGSETEATDELERLLMASTKSQMLSDVPLGAFLSGGVDSSTIVALMQAQSSSPVRSFSIGFEDPRFNEAEAAKAVAEYIGTKHTELYINAQDVLDLIPDLPQIFDEPFGSVSQVPTILLSRMTKQQVTVAMSGDGGDEFFGGYGRYSYVPRLWENILSVPMPARIAIGALAGNCPNALYSLLKYIVNKKGKGVGSKNDLDKGLNVAAKNAGMKNIDDLAASILTTWTDVEKVVPGSAPLSCRLSDPSQWPDLPTVAERMMAVDAMTLLPDDIMTKVDRSAMSASLETRAPLLDHRVIEFAARLPLGTKIKGKQRKAILRNLLYRHVPQELIERPKQGFTIPLDDWLRTSLRDWAEDLLSESRLKSDGFLNPKKIRRAWKAHVKGHRQNAHWLWPVLTFQSWLREHGS